MENSKQRSRDSIQKRLLANFILKQSSFYNIVEFKNSVGFSVEKRYGRTENPISLLKVAILDDNLQSNSEMLPVFVSAAYGELKNGYLDRLSIKKFRRQPIDIQAYEDYFYNTTDGKIYKNSKQINGVTLLNQVAKAHEARWRTIKGLHTRLHLEYLRLFSKTSRIMSRLIEAFLLVISGTKYSYDPIMAAFKEDQDRLSDPRQTGTINATPGKTISFLGYDASAWSVLFYCFMHMLVFAILFELNIRPHLIVAILKNNFLTIAYVISSLWLIEWAIPNLLRFLIKALSSFSFNYKYKKISIIL
jgi:hypothetical protein